MLKAWVALHCLRKPTVFMYLLLFLHSLQPDTPSSAQESLKFGEQVVGRYNMLPFLSGECQCLAPDFGLCHFDLSSARRGAYGCVVDGDLLKACSGQELHVICKVVDVLQHGYAAEILEQEACAYASLLSLQGQVIPQVYGFYSVWGILRMLAMETVGDALPEDEPIGHTLRTKMKVALKSIHDTGFIHGDTARRNFCSTADGNVFLVNLDDCRRFEDQSELYEEMRRV
ncbi:hypothetical protein CPB84DRAFT_1785215 [Gymnopilus junonius]|uniref:Protein kinase domain-containing protein n=1 Tax=Gymnopilus junonius TaxID=109634 RepID=A0A9P5TKU8_GYMJU|nr:hypothetical protein CPB84DRAFT_1785215 [Gymnopilus junonius]